MITCDHVIIIIVFAFANGFGERFCFNSYLYVSLFLCNLTFWTENHMSEKLIDGLR